MSKKHKKERIFLILVGLLFCIGLIIFFDKVAIFLFPDDKNRSGESVKLILSAIGGICLLYGLWINNKRAESTEKSVHNQEAQLRLSLKSQIDERFKNAIEHLGGEKETIILGGIAELHQIAKEYKDKYAEVVFNILCSYVRSETNVYMTIAEKINTTIVDTIFHYLFLRYPNNPYDEFKADLSHCNLSNQEIRHLNLKQANLSFSYFSNLDDSLLDFADFSRSNIFSISFKGNSMTGVKLSRTRIIHTDFKDVVFGTENTNSNHILLSPHCVSCRFENINFDKTTISGAIFIGCVFINCSFVGVEILSSKFHACTFINISLSNAEILSNIDFSASHFSNFSLNTFALELVLKSCSKGGYLSEYIDIEDRLTEQQLIVTNISDLGISELCLKDCSLGSLSESEVQSIKDKYNEITEIKPFPLNSKEV